MKTIKLSEAVYRDKVMGCWLGKNAGGSLGMPHEMMWGNEKTFDISFYRSGKYKKTSGYNRFSQ